MNLRRYFVPLGTWATLVLGIAYMVVFWWIGGQGNLAVALSLLALSLSIKAYGLVTARSTDKQG